MKKIELTHDIIAKEVFNSSSELHRMRRDVERRVKDRFADYQESGIPVAMEELHLILPYLGIVRISEEERSFILEMERRAAKEEEAKRIRVKKILVGLASLSLILIALSIFANKQRNEAREKSQENLAISLAFASEKALNDGKPSLAFRLAQESLKIEGDSSTFSGSASIKVLKAIAKYPFEKDIIHNDTITSFQFFGNEQFILSSSLDSTVVIWDENGIPIDTFLHDSPVINALGSMLDNRLVSITKDNSVFFWNERGVLIKKVRCTSEILDIKISYGDNFIIILTSDQIMRIFDFKTGMLNKEIRINSKIQNRTISSYLSSHNLEIAITSGFEMSNWNVNGEEIFQYDIRDKMPNRSPVNGLEVFHNGSLFLFHGKRGDFILKRNGYLATDRISSEFNGDSIIQSKFSTRGEVLRLMGTSIDSTRLIVWNYTLNKVDIQYFPKDHIICSEFSPNADYILCATDDNRTAILQAVKENSKKDSPAYINHLQLKCRINKCKFSLDGSRFLTSNRGNIIKLWNLKSDFLENLQIEYTNSDIEDFGSKYRQLTEDEKKLFQR